MKKIAIRLDVGCSIGLGHFMRCMSLAEILVKNNKNYVLLICRNILKIKVKFDVLYLEKNYSTNDESYHFPSICDELNEMKNILQEQHIDCLIVDHYGAGDDYFKLIRDSVSYLICIDDNMKRNIPVDMIINGNIYGKKADYGSVPIQLLGEKYTLIRNEFGNLPPKIIKNKVQHVYVTSGGADPLHFCEKIVNALEKDDNNLYIHIIVGINFNQDYIHKLESHKVVMHYNADIPKCMMDADLFITGAGSTLYELAITGTPSISYILADDQIKVAKEMWKKNCSLQGGYFADFNICDLLKKLYKLLNINARLEMSKTAQNVVNKNGVISVADKIIEMLYNM